MQPFTKEITEKHYLGIQEYCESQAVAFKVFKPILKAILELPDAKKSNDVKNKSKKS